MRRDKVEQAIAKIGRGPHQDVSYVVPSREEWPQHCIGLLSADEIAALRSALEFALEHHSNAELKGILNRTEAQFIFDSKGARQFLEAVFRQLSDC